ncbi:MAG: transposase [Anaerolineales bacterium]
MTPRQWAVLEPLVPPAERTGKRGRPPADPRKLLDAIFWKLAHHVPWQDLPGWYPSMLTCRRYYRRLLLSGRLDLLYSALYQDLLSRGKVSLQVLVEQECVAISENKVVLPHGLDKSWKMRTVLLFLQQGYQALRKERREKAQEHRRQSPTFILSARKKAAQAQAYTKQEIFSFTPIDLAHLGSDQENDNEPGNTLRKRVLQSPPHIDSGDYSFTPIDLGNLGSDLEGDDKPPQTYRKKPSLSNSQRESENARSLPSVLLGSTSALQITVHTTFRFFEPETHPPPLITQVPLSSLISYSPAVPNTQSHSGELTP